MILEGPAAALALAPLAFAGGLIYGITGFGSALVTIPLATHFVPLPFALAVFVIVDFISSLRISLEDPRKAVLPEIVRMVPMMMIGIVTGTTLLVNLPRQTSMVALGVFVLAYALYSFVPSAGTRTVSRGWAYVAGFCGGVTGTVFGAGGPPYAIYLSHRPLAKEQFRATLTLNSLFSIGLRLIAFAITGLLMQDGVWIVAAATLPGGLLGVWLASRVFRLISRETVLRAVSLMLLASGVSLIARALG
jgi:uncharacterized membrane protein YfcA